MDRSSHSKNKTLKRPGGKTTSSTSEGSPSTHTKDKSSSSTHVPELDLESLQSATVQEASASSSAEGPVIPKDNVLATLSARFSRNLNKNKLQPTASRRAVRMIESLPVLDSKTIDEWKLSTVYPTITFLQQSTKAARPGENFVSNISFSDPQKQEVFKIESVAFHKFFGGDGIMFFVKLEEGRSFYFLVRLVINEITLELASSLSAMEGNVSDPDSVQFSRWLDTGLNPNLNAYYQPQGLVLKRFNPVADDRRSLFLPFVVNTPESEQYKGRKYRLLFTVVGDNNIHHFAISKILEVGESVEYCRRRISKLIVAFLEMIEDSNMAVEVRRLLSNFVSSFPKSVEMEFNEDDEKEGKDGGREEGTSYLLEALKSLECCPRHIWTRRNYDGRILLHYVCALKSQKLVKYILEKCKDCVNFTDINSQTPLWSAIDNNSPVIIDMLAKSGANLKLRDLRGYNALEFAKSRRPIRHHIVRKINSYLGSTNNVSTLSSPESEKRAFSRTRTRSFVFEQSDVADGEISIALGSSDAHILAFHGYFEKLSDLLATPADVADKLNKTDINGTTPFHQAIRAGKIDIFSFFLTFPSLALTAVDIMNFLQFSYYGNKDMAKAIIDKGAHSPTEKKDRKSKSATPSNSSPLPALAKAISSFVPDHFGYTPLHTSCTFGHLDLLSLLLERESKDAIKQMITDKSRGDGGQDRVEVDSPYHLAALRGHTKLLKAIIDYDPELYKASRNLGLGKRTPLHLACRRGSKDTVELLVVDYKVDVNTADALGVTPALLAARYGHSEVLSLLIKQGANIEAKDDRGHTALHMAAIGGHSACIEVLLSANAKVEAVTLKWETALCLAINNGHKAVVQALIKNKANVNHLIASPEDSEGDGKDKEKPETVSVGARPIHLAAEGESEEIIGYLVEAGADINAQDKEGKTALMLAVHYLPSLVEIANTKGVNLDLQDAKGRTALYHALSCMCIKAGKDLLLKGCNFLLKDIDGVSPLELNLKEHKDVIMDVVKTIQEKNNNVHESVYKEAISLFNQKASQGIEHLQKSGVLKNPAWDIAWFFGNYSNNLSKIQLGIYLGGEDELNISTLKAFTNRLDFSEMTYDKALRYYLHFFMLPGEAQKIDRIMECFAHRYHQNNSNVFPDADTAFILAFSLIMLNTDLHNPNIKNKMTKDQFLRNNRDQDPPRDLYSRLYDAIAEEEIEFEREGYVFGGAERKGYLKKFSPPRTWTKRYFILKESCLYYFKSPKDDQPYGIIVLENLTVIKNGSKRFTLSTKDGSPVKYCKTSNSGVMVQGTQKEIVFCADTEALRNEWIASLQTNVAENPFYELIAKRIEHLVEKAQSTQEIYLTPEHIKQYLDWCTLCQDCSSEQALREKWGDSLTLCSTEGDLKYALIEEGKINKLAFTQELWVPELIQHIQKTKTTKFDFMEHFHVQDVLKAVAKKILPNIRKYGETQICGFGFGSVIAIQMGMLLQAQGYTVKRILTFGQPKVIAAKDFSSCNLLGLLRILLPKDPALSLFDNHSHAGQQLVLTSKPQLESMPSFGEQVSMPTKLPKNIIKKGTSISQEFSLAAYSKALSHVKL